MTKIAHEFHTLFSVVNSMLGFLYFFSRLVYVARHNVVGYLMHANSISDWKCRLLFDIHCLTVEIVTVS